MSRLISIFVFLFAVIGNAWAACPPLQPEYGFNTQAFNADLPGGPATFAMAGKVTLGSGGRGTYNVRGAYGSTEVAASGPLVYWQASNCQIGLSFRGQAGEFDALLDPSKNGLRAGGYLVGSVAGAKFTAPANIWPAASGACTAADIRQTYSTRTHSFNQPTDTGDATFFALGRATFWPANANVRWGYWYSVNGADGAPYVSGPASYTLTPDCWLTWTEVAPDRTLKRTVMLRRIVGGIATGGSGYVLTTPAVGQAYTSPLNMWRSGYEPTE